MRCRLDTSAPSSGTSSKLTLWLVYGSGPVGLFAARSAWLMGAGRVIVVDHLDYRLPKAREFAHAETLNFTEHPDVVRHSSI
jgi:alcohol dehydrogenase